MLQNARLAYLVRAESTVEKHFSFNRKFNFLRCDFREAVVCLL